MDAVLVLGVRVRVTAGAVGGVQNNERPEREYHWDRISLIASGVQHQEQGFI